jgi:hypothetical protein
MRLPLTVKFFLLTLLISGTFRVQGQVHVGAKIGWNHNIPKNDSDLMTDQSLSGWHAGVYAQFPVVKNLSLIPEVQFSTRNYSLNTFRDNLNFGYIEVPLLISWAPAKWINLEAGPNIAFKVFSETERGVSLDEIFDKGVDIGFVAGPRLNITNNLSVVARYWLSVVPFVDYDFYDASGIPLGKLKLYNRTVEISLAWTFKPIREH